jgi:A/G-specific adenine glycosylase
LMKMRGLGTRKKQRLDAKDNMSSRKIKSDQGSPISKKMLLRIQEGLLQWFAENGRDLPWRRKYAPYEVWISEIMLQQTQIKTMLPYYHRWMERFPDLRSVANAPEDELLRCWEGLGYYARVKNIQKAARQIVSEFGGKLPCDFDSIRALPGIGRYTAGAIMSFACNADYPAADANAARILARIFNISIRSDLKEFQDAVWHYATEILPSGHARNFNQALMDFGSRICVSGVPLCAECPIAFGCGSFAAGTAERIPVKAVKKAPEQIRRVIGIFLRDEKVLIRKRPESGLMPNLWEFPGGDAQEGETPKSALRGIWLRELGVRIGFMKELLVVKHSHTSFRVTLHAFLCEGRGPMPDSSDRLRWLDLGELEKFGFPAAHRKVIRVLMETSTM